MPTQATSTPTQLSSTAFRAVVIAYVLCFGAPALAGPFPDYWSGAVKLSMEVTLATPGAAVRHVVEGDIELTVVLSRAVGQAELTATYDWAVDPCKASGRVPFQVTYGVTLDGEGEKYPRGATINLSPAQRSYPYSERMDCGRLGVKQVARQWLPPPLPPGRMILADGFTLHFESDQGPVQGKGTATFVAPCTGWDSRKEPGPKVIFIDEDPRTVQPREPSLLNRLSSKDLTNKADAQRDEGAIARRKAMKAVDLGLTEYLARLDEFTVDARVSRTTPQNKAYADCVFADSVTVRIPTLIEVSIASELDVGDSCRQAVEAHERRHVAAIWNALRAMASEIEGTLNLKVPGPANALPMSQPDAVDVLRQRIGREIAAVIARNLKDLRLTAIALDQFNPTDKAAVRSVCSGWIPT